jgi:hypothetical protein
MVVAIAQRELNELAQMDEVTHVVRQLEQVRHGHHPLRRCPPVLSHFVGILSVL